jgi:hypothetical protein
MFGNECEKRQFVKDIGFLPPHPNVEVNYSSWQFELMISLSFIQQIYGRSDFQEGRMIRGNFYKCGDETNTPHWGSWHTLGKNPVNFHQPETFGVF